MSINIPVDQELANLYQQKGELLTYIEIYQSQLQTINNVIFQKASAARNNQTPVQPVQIVK